MFVCFFVFSFGSSENQQLVFGQWFSKIDFRKRERGGGRETCETFTNFNTKLSHSAGKQLLSVIVYWVCATFNSAKHLMPPCQHLFSIKCFLVYLHHLMQLFSESSLLPWLQTFIIVVDKTPTFFFKVPTHGLILTTFSLMWWRFIAAPENAWHLHSTFLIGLCFIPSAVSFLFLWTLCWQDYFTDKMSVKRRRGGKCLYNNHAHLVRCMKDF